MNVINYQLQFYVPASTSHLVLVEIMQFFLTRCTYSTLCEDTTAGLKYLQLKENYNPLTRTDVRRVEGTTAETCFGGGLPWNYESRCKSVRLSVNGI